MMSERFCHLEKMLNFFLNLSDVSIEIYGYIFKRWRNFSGSKPGSDA